MSFIRLISRKVLPPARPFSSLVNLWGDPNSKMAGLQGVLLGMGKHLKSGTATQPCF